MGCVPPAPGFLEGLREITSRDGALLILDEVMTGFRVAAGGAQERFGVEADITTLGKIIGGGLPVGAYGGSRKIMEKLSPAGPIYQAGTLSGNPLAVAAGLATLRLLGEPGVYERLETLGRHLEKGVTTAIEKNGWPLCFQRVGAMFCLYFSKTPVTNYAEAKASDTQKFARYFHGMLENGVYLAPSRFEAGFLSLAHEEADLDRVIATGAEVLGGIL